MVTLALLGVLAVLSQPVGGRVTSGSEGRAGLQSPVSAGPGPRDVLVKAPAPSLRGALLRTLVAPGPEWDR